MAERVDRDDPASDYERFFALSLDLLGIVGRDGRFRRLNAAWARAVGYTEAELLATPLLELVHPDDRAATAAALQRRGEGTLEFEHRFLCRGGTHRWLAWRLVPAPDDGLLYGIAHDVTDRRRAEEARRESEERYRTLFDQAPVGVFLYDPRMRIVECNARFVTLLATRRDALIGLDMATLRDTRVLPAIARSLAGEPALYEGRYEATTSGARIWISMRLAPLRDAAGRVVGGMGVVEDVTLRVDAEDALRRSAARFRELIERSPDAVVVHRAGRFIYVNPATVTVLGYAAAEELIGQPATAVVHPEDRPAALARARHIAATGEAVPPVEERFLRRDGSSMVAEVRTLPIEFDGAPAVLAIARDVSERKLIQARLLQADRLVSVGTLAAGVAHEINNPLAYVIANLDFIAQALPRIASAGARPDAVTAATLAAQRADLEDMVRVARDGAERVRRIVQSLKAFSRADDEHRGPVDLHRVLDVSVNMAWNEIRARARLVKQYGAVPPVRASEWRLGQVFLNLLVNAAQAIPEGDTRQHEIVVSTRTDGAGHAVVEVRDTGAGIAPDVIGRIFDPFFTTKPVGVGTGLGLSVCHGIVAWLGGELAVESEVDRGATFRVTLPADGTVAQPALPEVATPGAGCAPRARILIVDDEPALAHALRVALAEEHDVVVAPSGRHALELLQNDPRFDLVLCDLIMPDVTGMDLYDAQPTGLRERFVFMTGGAFTARAQQFVAAVPNLCLDKPFDLGQIERFLRERAART